MLPIDHLNRYVSDVDAFIAFYENVLGYQLLDRGTKASGHRYAILQGMGHELFISERDDYQSDRDPNFRHIGYAVADADKLLSELKEKGIVKVDVEIIVKDDGIGLSPEEAEQVFLRFYRGANAQHAAHGTGLGLPVAKAIIEAHHGTIGITGQVGEGAEARVWLPVEDRIRAIA